MVVVLFVCLFVVGRDLLGSSTYVRTSVMIELVSRRRNTVPNRHIYIVVVVVAIIVVVTATTRRSVVQLLVVGVVSLFVSLASLLLFLWYD